MKEEGGEREEGGRGRRGGEGGGWERDGILNA